MTVSSSKFLLSSEHVGTRSSFAWVGTNLRNTTNSTSRPRCHGWPWLHSLLIFMVITKCIQQVWRWLLCARSPLCSLKFIQLLVNGYFWMIERTPNNVLITLIWAQMRTPLGRSEQLEVHQNSNPNVNDFGEQKWRQPKQQTCDDRSWKHNITKTTTKSHKHSTLLYNHALWQSSGLCGYSNESLFIGRK